LVVWILYGWHGITSERKPPKKEQQQHTHTHQKKKKKGKDKRNILLSGVEEILIWGIYISGISILFLYYNFIKISISLLER
jgi:hypothetical protein